MIILNERFLVSLSKERPIEKITMADFAVEMKIFHTSSLVAFKQGNKVKILKNYSGNVGIFTLEEFVDILESKLSDL